jgi:crotonobetainyl-CoA:carnitine CoA-transferase CaiB-like acyl-CoA transferase
MSVERMVAEARHTVGQDFFSPRVLELGGRLAAMTGRALRVSGARVTRVELPTVAQTCWDSIFSDLAEMLEACSMDPGFASRRALLENAHENDGKEVLQGDVDLLWRLLEHSDVLVTDLSTRQLVSIGLDPSIVEHSFERLVQVQLSWFGASGPRSSWEGSDLVAAATGGMAALCGEIDEPPMSPPREQASRVTALSGAIAAWLGIHALEVTGRGQTVEIAAQEVVASTLEYPLVAYVSQGKSFTRNGSRYPHVPHRVYKVSDGYVAGGYGGTQRMWNDLISWLEEAGVAQDLSQEYWMDPQRRWDERDHVEKALANGIERFTRDEVLAQAAQRGLPWAPVRMVVELLKDPQIEHRGFLVDIVPASDSLKGAKLKDCGAPGIVTRSEVFTSASASSSRASKGKSDHSGSELSECLDQLGGNRGSVPIMNGLKDENNGRTIGNHGLGSLAGLRVLDLTWVLAGPFATRILADHGAEVIKIESHRRPDPSRYSPSMRFRDSKDKDPDTSAYFANFNRNKKSILLDLKNPDSRWIIEQLVVKSHVIFENFSAGVLERLGLSPAELFALNPSLVVVRMSGLGQSGPLASYGTYADTLAAMSGLTAETVGPDGVPRGVAFGLSDMIAGYWAVLLALSELQRARLTRQGSVVDLSQLECTLSSLGSALLEVQVQADLLLERAAQPYAAPEVVLGRPDAQGTVPASAPLPRKLATSFHTSLVYDSRRDPALIGTYRAADGEWVVLAVTNLRKLRRLEALVKDQESVSASAHDSHETWLEELGTAISSWVAMHASTEVVGLFQKEQIAAGVVEDACYLLERDDHLQERGFFSMIEHSKLGWHLEDGVPIKMRLSPGELQRPAPLLGQDTREVLGRLVGLSEAEIDRMEQRGVLA